MLKYAMEFQTLFCGIGPNYNCPWAKEHFERGLVDEIKDAFCLNVTEDNDIPSLAIKMQRLYDNLERSHLLQAAKTSTPACSLTPAHLLTLLVPQSWLVCGSQPICWLRLTTLDLGPLAL